MMVYVNEVSSDEGVSGQWYMRMKVEWSEAVGSREWRMKTVGFKNLEIDS